MWCHGVHMHVGLWGCVCCVVVWCVRVGLCVMVCLCRHGLSVVGKGSKFNSSFISQGWGGGSISIPPTGGTRAVETMPQLRWVHGAYH